MENVRRLHHVSARFEHGRVGQPLLDELESHEPVVDVRKARTREPDHVDLDAAARKIVHQRADQDRGILPGEEGGVVSSRWTWTMISDGGVCGLAWKRMPTQPRPFSGRR